MKFLHFLINTFQKGASAGGLCHWHSHNLHENSIFKLEHRERNDTQGRSQPHSPGWARVHLSSNLRHFFLLFPKLSSFLSSFWPSGWATWPSGEALAMPQMTRWSILWHLDLVQREVHGALGPYFCDTYFFSSCSFQQLDDRTDGVTSHNGIVNQHDAFTHEVLCEGAKLLCHT